MSMKKVIVFLTILITGCATHTPIPQPAPVPIPCEVKIKGECREMTAGEKGGAVTRGHGEDIKETK